MDINVNAIIEAKLAQMTADGIVEQAITVALEKLVIESFKKAFDNWDLQKRIETKVAAEISDLANEVGLGGYREFLLKQTGALIDMACRDDLKARANEYVKEAYLKTRESITLDEIIEAYKEIQMEEDERDRYDRQSFFLEIQREEKSYGSYLNVTMHSEKPKTTYGYRTDIDVKLTFSMNRTDKNATLASMFLNGDNVDQKKGFRFLSKFDALLLNIYYNHTPVIINSTDADDYDTSVYDED